MNSFRQHIPAFVEVDHPPAIPFETTADLLALPVVQRYKGSTFSRFAMSDKCLMVIEDDGFQWWVVGFIADPSAIDLPKWDGWKHLARLPDGREVVLTNEVVSSCGGQLTLRDGTVATDVRYERQMAKQKADRAKENQGICARCDIAFTTTEAPDDRGFIEIRQVCSSCGQRITSWRKEAVKA